MTFDTPVVSALLPVVLLIGIGWIAGRTDTVRPEAVRDLSNLVFLVLTQALLFRTMSSVHVERLDWAAVSLYYIVAGALFFVLLFVQGLSSRSAVIALAAIFSNTVMIGIPLAALTFGEAGLVHHFTLISAHALVLLTLATVVLELLAAKEQAQVGDAVPPSRLRTVAMAVKNAIIHPVPIPILAGLAYAQTGWGLPAALDKPLKLMGDAFGPVSLLLVGITLAQVHLGAHWRGALVIASIKTLLHPLLMVLACWLLGIRGLPMGVMVLAASLPVGANVFLFSQRYHRAEDLVTSSVAVSTLMALISVTLVLTLLPRFM